MNQISDRWAMIVAAGWFALLNVCGQDEAPALPEIPAENLPAPAPGPGGVSTGFNGARTSTENPFGDAENGVRVQIQVEADDPFIKATFQNAAQQVKLDFSKVLMLPIQNGVIPIRIKITGKPSDIWNDRDLVNKVSIAVDGTFLITLHVRLHESFSSLNFEREMIRVLILQEMLRPHVENPDTLKGDELVVPPWLIFGLQDHFQYRKRGSRSELFAGVLDGGNILKVEDILTQNTPEKLDPMTRAVFEASASALVSTLLDQEDGSASFQALLMSYAMSELSPGADPTTRLKEHFPAMRDNAGALGKWWTLQLAEMSERTAFDSYSIAETQRLFDDALKIILIPQQPDAAEGKKSLIGKWFSKMGSSKREDVPEEFQLNEFGKFIDHPNLEQSLNRNLTFLQELQARGFPLYRELALRYSGLFDRILAGNKLGLSGEVKDLEKIRRNIDAILERVNDYMNYYEATQAPKSDAFEGYQKMRKKLESSPPPPRNDRISNYLDELEREFK